MKASMKRFAAVLMLALLLVGVTTAFMPAMAETVKTKSITLNKSGTVKVNIGATLSLSAVVRPDNSTQPVTWSSSRKSVATVDADGQVTGVKAGTATITVKSGTRKDTVKVKVVDPTMPTSVKLDKHGTVKVPIGSELTLSATMGPATAESGLSWSSSKKKVATVSGGVVKARKVGTAKITVKTARGKKKASVKVKVYDPYLPKSVKLDKSGTVKVPIGSELTLTPTLSPDTAQSGFTWKSSKKKVATVKDGVVTARKVGTATITVTTRNKKKAKVKIKVYDPYLPSSVKLDKTGTQKVLLSKQLNLAATLSPATAQSNLKWKSSNKKVAKVSSSGVVTAVNIGTATITVTTRNNKSAKVKIKVYDDGKLPITTPAGYSLPYVIYACKKSHTIAILARDENGEWNRVIRLFSTGMGRKNVTDTGGFTLTKKERWHNWGSGYSPYANMLSVGIYLHGPIYNSKSFNSLRVSYYNLIGTDCSSGCLRTTCGCAAWVYYNCPVGTKIIVAENSRFSTGRPAKLKKTATKDPTNPGSNPEILITKFDVSPASVTMEQGRTQALTISDVYPANNSTGMKFSYTSSNTAVATVSSSGVVTAVGQGSATITVVAGDDFKATVKVPVTVSGGILAGAEPVAGEKLAEDADAATAVPEDVIVIEDDKPAETPEEEVKPDETPAEKAEEVKSDGEAPAEAPEAEADPAEESDDEIFSEVVDTLVSGTDDDLTANPEDVAEDENGMTFEIEDLAEEQTEIIIEDE